MFAFWQTWGYFNILTNITQQKMAKKTAKNALFLVRLSSSI
jgi:hypothetical protein